MTDKLHEASEIAASGLKNDSELYLSVQREIEMHLQETAERLENAGQNHDKAINTALEKFGSPTEAADAILKVNKRRLKFRARLRLVMLSLLPTAALTIMLFSILPEWNYIKLKKEMWYSLSGLECRKKAARAAGFDLSKISTQQQLVLDWNWNKLHKMFPKNKAYFAYYFMNSIDMRRWSGGYAQRQSRTVHDQLKKAEKIDPGNALYDYFAAVELLYLGSKHERRKSTGTIYDRVKLMEALPYYLKGLRQPFYNNYRNEITLQRIALIPDKKTPKSQLWINYLCFWSIYDDLIIDYIAQAIPLWGEELIKAKRFQEAEQVLDSWRLFILQNNKRKTAFYKYVSCMHMFKALEKKLPPLYQKIGKPKKAFKAKKDLNYLISFWTKRWDKKSPEKITTKQMFFKHAPYIQHYLGSLLLPEEYKLEDLTTGRLREYAHADRILLLLIEILLSCLMLGYGICWLLVRFRLKKTLQPVLFIPNGKTLFKLILTGIVIPLILWRVLILLQPGGRDYALTCSSINFLAQGLFLIIGMTLWPMALMRYCTEKHVNKLGMPGYPRKNGLIWVLSIAVITAILACIPWRLWININIIYPFHGFIMPMKLRAYPDLYIIEWWYWALALAFLAVLFILSAPITTLCNWRKPDNLFRCGASAAAMLVVSAIMLITAATLADGYFYWQEQHFVKLDKTMNDKGRVSYRDRIIKNGRMRILKALGSPKACPVNINILYSFTDDKNFCAAVKSSPYFVLKESLKRGANADAVSSNGEYSALMLACRYRNAKVVKLLLDHGAKVKKYCPGINYGPKLPKRLTGVNALMVASFYNPDPEIIKLLLKHGAEINNKAPKGYSRQDKHIWRSYKMTALMFACWNNNAEVINVLLDNGANVYDKNSWGKDILFYLGKNPKIYGNKIKNRIKALRKAKKH